MNDYERDEISSKIEEWIALHSKYLTAIIEDVNKNDRRICRLEDQLNGLMAAISKDQTIPKESIL